MQNKMPALPQHRAAARPVHRILPPPNFLLLHTASCPTWIMLESHHLRRGTPPRHYGVNRIRLAAEGAPKANVRAHRRARVATKRALARTRAAKHMHRGGEKEGGGAVNRLKSSHDFSKVALHFVLSDEQQRLQVNAFLNLRCSCDYRLFRSVSGSKTKPPVTYKSSVDLFE